MSASRDIKIFISSTRYEVAASIFSDDSLDGEIVLSTDGEPEPEQMEIKSLGRFCIDGDRAMIEYEESELTGMAGSRTCVSFDMREPQTVTMIRTGEVSTTLVFEKGKRHHCTYHTPYMPFEVCVRTLDVKNGISESGLLEIDYIVEIRGARAERNKFSMRIMN